MACKQDRFTALFYELLPSTRFAQSPFLSHGITIYTNSYGFLFEIKFPGLEQSLDVWVIFFVFVFVVRFVELEKLFLEYTNLFCYVFLFWFGGGAMKIFFPQMMHRQPYVQCVLVRLAM